MKNLLLASVFLVISANLLAQCGVPGFVCMGDGNVTVSDGFNLYDDGFGGPYTNTDYTLVLCPDTPGDVVQLTFNAFALQTSPNAANSDYLSVFDGNSTAAPSLGDYTGNSIQGLQITGTVTNTSGCLTLVFSSNGADNVNSPGFEAAIQCTTPCANPLAASAIVNPAPVDPTIQTVNVCLGDDITFGDAGSTAQAGFNLARYIWNFDDGTIITNTTAANVQHSFTEPGEYIVVLTVEDDNLGDDAVGCQSLNVQPLQVLVSTYPTFTGMTDLETCLGDTVMGVMVIGENVTLPDDTNIGGSASGTTWTALPPQVVAGETYLADGAGFSYSTSLNFDFFEAGATLNSCDDLDSIFVNMEHSYMGDLGLYITCPNGTLVNLVEWATNGGGGTFLGQALDDAGTDPGVGWDYAWTPTATNGTWGANSGTNTVGVTTPTLGNALAPGIYQSAEDLCSLVGCPLNGQWTFSVADNLAIDNGYIFSWGIGFNPELYPGVTTFTPTIGAGADSSFWVTNGPENGIQWISDISTDADIIEIIPEQLGVWDFTYRVINSFGCMFDSTIQVTVTQAPFVTAGSDAVVACLPTQLDGGLLNEPDVACADCGNYTYCYTTFDFYQQTYCPDNAGDGFVTISFTAGELAVNDNLYVFDGPNTWPSPQLGFYTGDLTGLSWTSTDPSGCLTFYISEWDGVGNCVDGGAAECAYSVTAGSAVAAGFVWEWTPDNPLDFPNTPEPQVLGLPQPSTTFTLVGYPAGHPGCASSDQVVISIDPNNDPGIGGPHEICASDSPFDLFSLLGGTPVNWGEWLFNGVPLANSTFDPQTSLPGDYVYFLDSGPNCSSSSTITINMPLPTTMTIADDTTLCDAGTVNLDLYLLTPGLPPYNYNWEFNGQPVSSMEDFMMNPTESGQACLTVTDACDYSITQCLQVDVLPPISPAFTADTTQGCWPNEYVLSVENELTEYSTSRWMLSDGSVILNQPNAPVSFDAPGLYGVELILINSAGCEYSIANNAYLTSYAPPTVGYTVGPQPTDIYDTELHFESVTNGYPITDYAWTFSSTAGGLLGGSAAANPVFTFPNDYGGTYLVNLEVTDIHNCTAFVSGNTVQINDITQFYIPSGFTPNNDGLNDVLQFVGADIDETRFQFEVFNRFGEKMFESADPNSAWTGNTGNGEYYAPNGVYSWRAIVVSKSTGVKKEINGSIIIMR
ncbi:MAG: PKD domain-containing protein [Flavobacteriales bacterium]